MRPVLRNVLAFAVPAGCYRLAISESYVFHILNEKLKEIRDFSYPRSTHSKLSPFKRPLYALSTIVSNAVIAQGSWFGLSVSPKIVSSTSNTQRCKGSRSQERPKGVFWNSIARCDMSLQNVLYWWWPHREIRDESFNHLNPRTAILV